MNPLKKIKNKIINKVSDVMSYPARRNAQKSILNSNANATVLRNRSASDKANFKYSLENKGGLGGMPNQELIAQKRAVPPIVRQVPKGWDAKTYDNFKTANPKLEPNAEDTARMKGTYKLPTKVGKFSNGVGVGP